MANLSFAVTGARAERHTAAPAITFRVRIREAAGAHIHALLLRVAIRIQPRGRKYGALEQERLGDLFGAAGRWTETVRPLLWSNTTLITAAFAGEVETDLGIPCTYDMEVASAKYFNALDEGEIPLLFLFSGTVFARAENGFRVEQVPWEKEAAFRLPVQTWKDAMESHFPECGWIRLRRSSLDALQRIKSREALFTWDDVIETLVNGKPITREGQAVR
ncbi:MAG TPA: DUF6084 family protein [Candidatus Acidoferrales bacterium]|nr:DUF6084 family protein [Candidatus Acidoferrales bacterium]